jgi:hypothetical protein
MYNARLFLKKKYNARLLDRRLSSKKKLIIPKNDD